MKRTARNACKTSGVNRRGITLSESENKLFGIIWTSHKSAAAPQLTYRWLNTVVIGGILAVFKLTRIVADAVSESKIIEWVHYTFYSFCLYGGYGRKLPHIDLVGVSVVFRIVIKVGHFDRRSLHKHYFGHERYKDGTYPW